ncbi:UDP-xylose and UDP-N-acetylglucosamine transporter isoform X1 [Lingula anatina]|uniref:UDP-xylose and UDP-N-acetylglucosamine transporter isoform X1 n=1 Tax=Lingula anatina TaxID=7574 RepID=A0A1S3K2P7_LINAN|nr:UDP-xylose and UDP-N-acetylglucosamine transporter isoform X1 [Lingula anatina]|eukprot:XP_013385439.1 UDP-xylose and UDP-N-acetylglucosamine transporter isoform X1 [Lingula anatina]
MHPGFPIAAVFLGCCSNVVVLEYLVREFPGSGNIVTFSQFLFIALEGFIFHADFGRRKPVVPIRHYVVMVTIFFVVQVVNNLVLGFNISMPLHMIFRSGSLIANLFLGVLILKKSYKLSKYLSVIMITIGIAICTIASAKKVKSEHLDDGSDGMYDLFIWIIGISGLTFALLMSARMGIYQETIYARFGKHPKEALFYNHALPLPAFLLLGKDIYNHAVLFTGSEPIDVPYLPAIPRMWFFLALNVLTQYICIRAVFILTTECQSLTVTLVVTLRKFTSLLFSIMYFKNPFTVYHWVGTVLVFTGTMLFVDIYNILKSLLGKTKAE